MNILMRNLQNNMWVANLYRGRDRQCHS